MPKKHDTSPATFPITPPFPRRRRGFTLAELLVVIGIIALLVSILVPVIGRVRISGQAADTAALIRAIDAACQTYQSDHQAYPGPLAADELGLGNPSGITSYGLDTSASPAQYEPAYAGDSFFRPAGELTGVTGAENLVLGLLGGLVYGDTDGDNTPDTILYDPAAVGRGALKLQNQRSPGSYSPYFDGDESDLSMHVIGEHDIAHAGGSAGDGKQWGRFVEESAAAQDSIIPEFVDRFSNPLPILYMRARPTGRIITDDPDPAKINIHTRIISDDADDNPVFMHSEIDSYIVANGTISIGIGKRPEKPYYVSGVRLEEVPGAMPYYHGLQLDVYPTGITAPTPANLQDLRSMMSRDVPDSSGSDSSMYTYPYDARAYLLHPSEANARQADRYVLISAGPDRVYGTEDDITNFGSLP